MPEDQDNFWNDAGVQPTQGGSPIGTFCQRCRAPHVYHVTVEFHDWGVTITPDESPLCRSCRFAIHWLEN